jgi:hypothetical protein
MLNNKTPKIGRYILLGKFRKKKKERRWRLGR